MQRVTEWLVIIVISLGCLPAYAEAAVENKTELQVAAELFVDQLTSGQYGQAIEQFDEKMKQVLTEPQLEVVWQHITSQTGPFKKRTDVHSRIAGVNLIVFVTCEFENKNLDAKIVFNGDGQISGLFFVPTEPGEGLPAATPKYLEIEDYREKAIEVGNESPMLPGVLTLPGGDGPFPAVVLVHGSGPADRDETIGPNKPFRDIAMGLVSKGIAVLRYDKRTLAFPPMEFNWDDDYTVMDETIHDVLTAIEMLKGIDAIDSQRIFVLGHSFGGYLAPRIAENDPHIAGLIIMAGPTRSLLEILPEQLNYIFSLDGSISAEEQKILDTIEYQIMTASDAKLSVGRPNPKNLPFGAPKSYWLDLRDYDPVQTAQTLSQPILVLHAGRDYQVTKVDYQQWRNGLAGMKNAKVKIYPKMNHLFIEGKGRATPAEYEQPGHVSPTVIEDISRWIKLSK